MNTFEMLASYFGGSPVIPLGAAAKMWSYTEETLAKKIDDRKVALPYFRLDEGQKAERIIMLSDLAALIEQQHRAAQAKFFGDEDTNREAG